MKHPQHDLLIAAANDVDARFYCQEWNNGCHVPIQPVIMYQDFNWKLVDKFAELKNAYAEGRTIQYRYFNGGNPTPPYMWSEWKDANIVCINGIIEGFIDINEYRIKPEPVYEWQWLIQHKVTGRYKTSDFYTTEPIMPHFVNIYRIEESKREVKLSLEVEECY